jgi:hypothetical protein
MPFTEGVSLQEGRDFWDGNRITNAKMLQVGHERGALSSDTTGSVRERYVSLVRSTVKANRMFNYVVTEENVSYMLDKEKRTRIYARAEAMGLKMDDKLEIDEEHRREKTNYSEEEAETVYEVDMSDLEDLFMFDSRELKVMFGVNEKMKVRQGVSIDRIPDSEFRQIGKQSGYLGDFKDTADMIVDTMSKRLMPPEAEDEISADQSLLKKVRNFVGIDITYAIGMACSNILATKRDYDKGEVKCFEVTSTQEIPQRYRRDYGHIYVMEPHSKASKDSSDIFIILMEFHKTDQVDLQGRGGYIIFVCENNLTVMFRCTQIPQSMMGEYTACYRNAITMVGNLEAYLPRIRAAYSLPEDDAERVIKKLLEYKKVRRFVEIEAGKSYLMTFFTDAVCSAADLHMDLVKRAIVAINDGKSAMVWTKRQFQEKLIGKGGNSLIGSWIINGVIGHYVGKKPREVWSDLEEIV